MPKWYADNAAVHPGMVFMTRTRQKIHGLFLGGLAAGLTACATLPPPIQLMDRAQAEIRAARNAGAATTAPEALAEAERRLAAAQQLSANGDNDKATEKAQEAEAAAASARARADAARLGREIRQQSAVNRDLEVDLERRQAAAAAAQQAAMVPPAPAASGATPPAQGMAPVTLPSIELGQPAQPAPASSSDLPASGGSSGEPGEQP